MLNPNKMRKKNNEISKTPGITATNVLCCLIYLPPALNPPKYDLLKQIWVDGVFSSGPMRNRMKARRESWRS